MGAVADWTPADFDDAASLYDDPEAGLSEQERSALGKKIVLYQASQKRPDVYGATGIDAVEAGRRTPEQQSVLQTPEPQRRRREATRRAEREFLPMEQASSVFAARSAEPADLSDQPELGEIESPEAAQERRGLEITRDETLLKLPSLSKDPALYRPPVYQANPKAPAEHGRPFFEPSVEEFQAAGGQGDENSPEYHRFADAAYAQAYDAGVRRGEGIWRVAFSGGVDPSGNGQVSGLGRGMQALDLAATTAGGVLSGILPGSDRLAMLGSDERSLADMEASQLRNPVARTLGVVGGAMHPLSLGSKVAGGVYKAAAPAGAGLARRVGAGAAAGAVAGGTESLAGTAIETAAGMADGNSVDFDPVFEAEKATLSTLLGGGFGAGGQLAAEGIGAGMRRLRRGQLRVPLAAAEKAGYETSAIHGMRPTRELQETIDASARAGHVHPIAELSEDVADRAALSAHDIQAESHQRIGKNVEGYYKWSDNNPKARVAPDNFVGRAFEWLTRRSTGEGGDVAAREGRNNQLRTWIKSSTKGEIVDAMDADAMRLSDPTVRVMSMDDLQSAGFTPKDMVEMVGRENAPPWLLSKVGSDDVGVVERTVNQGLPVGERGTLPPGPSDDLAKNFEGLIENGDDEVARTIVGNLAMDDLDAANRGSTNLPVRDKRDLYMNPETGSMEEGAGDEIGVVDFPATFAMVLRPKPMSPRVFDEMVRGVDEAAGLVGKGTGKPDDMFASMTEAARLDRERFPSHPKFAPKTDPISIFDGDGKPRKLSGWAGQKAKADFEMRQNRELFESAGLPAQIPPRESVPSGKGEQQPKALGFEKTRSMKDRSLVRPITPPKLEPAQKQRVEGTARGYFHGEGSHRSNEALRELAERATPPFLDRLEKIAGIRFGEELRYGKGAGVHMGMGLGFSPVVRTSLGQKAALRLDAIGRRLSAMPADEATKVIGPDLMGTLRGMRTGKPTKESVTLGQQVLGLAGGQIGARVGATKAADDKLTSEDIENLKRILELSERKESN